MPPSRRCEFESCKKKLDLTAFPCKCTKFYCSLHRISEDHACTYDYVADARRELLKTMSSPVLAAKVAII